MPLKKIVFGGQTGVDRAALDAALAVGFPCGGWAPGDRMAEVGIIPERYPLMVLPKGGYRQRTRLNVSDSDRTAILYNEPLKGAHALRATCARFSIGRTFLSNVGSHCGCTDDFEVY